MSTKKDKTPTKRYCSHCGSQLKKEVKKHGYYRSTGKPYYHTHFICPKIVWWKGLFNDMHTTEEYDDDGDYVFHFWP